MERNEIKTWFDMAFDYLIEGDFASACECFEYIINFSKDASVSNIARRYMEWWCFPVKAMVEQLRQTPHPVTLEELLKGLKLDKYGGQARQYVDDMGDALKKISIVYLIGDNLWVYTDHLEQSLQRTFAQMFQNHEPTTLVELTNHLFVEHGYQLPLKLPVINSVKSFLGNMPEVVLLESGCVFSAPILQDFIAMLIEQIRATQKPASLSGMLQRVPWPQSVVENLQIPELSTWLRSNTNSELVEIAPEFWFLDDLIDLDTIDVTPIFTNLYHPVETIDIIRHYFFPGNNNNLEVNEEFLNLQTERLTINPYLKQIGQNSWITKQGYQIFFNELLTGLAQSERSQTIQELLLALKETHSLSEGLSDPLGVSFAKELDQSLDVIKIGKNTWLHKKAFPSILDRAYEFLSERGPNSIVQLTEECLGVTVKGMTFIANFVEEFQNELERDDRFIIPYDGTDWLAIPPGNRINNLAYQILYREHCFFSASELAEESRKMCGRAVRFQLTADERFKQASDGRWMLANWLLINDLAAAYLAKEKVGLIASDLLLKICNLHNITIVQAVFDPTGDPRFKRDPWGRWHCESAGKILTGEMLDKLVQIATYGLEWGVPLERLILRTFNEPPANFFNLEKTILADGRMIYCEGLWYPKEPCLQQVTPDQVKQVKAYLAEKKHPLSGVELAQTCLKKPICLTNLEEVLVTDPEITKIGSVGWVLKANQSESMGRPRLINSPVRSGRYTPSLNSIQLTELESGSQQPGQGGETPELRPRPHHMTVTLTFEDLRDGTLVITSAMRSFLNSSIELPTLKFTDEQRNELVCWCDLTNDLLYGLVDWFKTRVLNFGDKIRLGIKKPEGEFSIEVAGQHSEQVYLESLRRSQVEDLRQEAIRANRSYHDLTLEILDFFKTPLHIDDIWALVDYKRSARKSTISTILSSRPYFVSFGGGYWRFDEEEYTRMISHLENQVKRLEEENKKLNTQFKSLIQPASEFEKLQHQVEGLQIDLTVAQQAERQAREMQTQLETESDTLKSLLKQRDSELDLLKTDLAAQREQTKQIETELDSIGSEVQQLREQLTLQERENQELDAALDERTLELATVKGSIGAIESLRTQAEEREQKQKVSLDQAHASITMLNAELERRTQVIASLEKAIDDLSAKIESCEANYTQIKQANEEQLARNHELETTLRHVGSEFEQSESRCKQLETEISQADVKIHSGQQTIDELSSKYVALNDSYTQATSELKSSKSQFQVTSEINAQLQRRNTHLETELESRVKKINALEEKIRGLQGKLGWEQQEKEKLEASIHQLRSVYDAIHSKYVENIRILDSFPGRLAKWWDGVKGNQGRKKKEPHMTN